MKLVHEEEYKGYKITILAEYNSQAEIFYENKKTGEKYEGEVFLSADIFKNERCVKQILNKEDYSFLYTDRIIRDKYRISYGLKKERYGFLKLKVRKEIIHISDEYQRVLPLFIEYCKEKVDKIHKEEVRKNSDKEITDGLPDSLKRLQRSYESKNYNMKR